MQDNTHSSFSYLKTIQDITDNDIDLVLASLCLCKASQSQKDRTLHHIKKIIKEIKQRFDDLCKAGSENNCNTQIAAMKHIISDEYDYKGDGSENIQRSSFVRLIDTGKASSACLAVLVRHCADILAWKCDILNIAGYFICRMNNAAEMVLFDPYKKFSLVQAQDLRAMVKKNLGDNAELSSDFYTAISKRQLLIGLQNEVKYKQIESEDYLAALESVEMMRSIDPLEHRLLLDAGVLYARTHNPEKAIKVLEEYIDKEPNAQERYEAQIFMRQIEEDLLA